ncbi:MAG TPA: universal stress protein [Candidatus Limnocylindria bacterium]|nr:universal stress protein [Candidatus Limnocylindria bacterium]
MTSTRPRPLSAAAPRRAGGATGPWRHILLACDGAAGTIAAGRRAVELAARDGAALTIVLVRPAPATRAEPSVPPAADDIASLPEAIERVLAAATRAGIAAHGEVRRGQSGAAILDVAREVDADLIIIGRHGPCIGTSFAVANCGYVVTHSDRPVLVVQPWAREGDLLDAPLRPAAEEAS